MLLLFLLLDDDRYELAVAQVCAAGCWYVAVAGLVWRWTARR